MNNTFYGKLIFELSQNGRQGYSLPENRCAEYKMSDLPKGLMRENAPLLPEVDELSVVRHYTNMSNNNFGVDTGFYPLGSCTMKYNPKINEEPRDHPGRPRCLLLAADQPRRDFRFEGIHLESLCRCPW